MTVWHLQHHHAGDDMLEVPLGWTFGAIVSDCDTNSKIRARYPTRNRHAQPVVSAAKALAVARALSLFPHFLPVPPAHPSVGIFLIYVNTDSSDGREKNGSVCFRWL